jgi:hypothetical protein
MKFLSIGIDFGNTIGLLDADVSAPFASAMIHHLLAKVGAENASIVSKASEKKGSLRRDQFPTSFAVILIFHWLVSDASDLGRNFDHFRLIR